MMTILAAIGFALVLGWLWVSFTVEDWSQRNRDEQARRRLRPAPKLDEPHDPHGRAA